MSATARFLYMRVSTSPARRVIRYERVYVNCRLQREEFFEGDFGSGIFLGHHPEIFDHTYLQHENKQKKISATMWNSREKCRQNAEVAAGKITTNFKIKQWDDFRGNFQVSWATWKVLVLKRPGKKND